MRGGRGGLELTQGMCVFVLGVGYSGGLDLRV